MIASSHDYCRAPSIFDTVQDITTNFILNYHRIQNYLDYPFNEPLSFAEWADWLGPDGLKNYAADMADLSLRVTEGWGEVENG